MVELELLHPGGPEGRSGGPKAHRGVRPPTPPKTPGFNETTTGFKFLLQKTRETAIFGPSFNETLKKKKVRFPPKTEYMVIFDQNCVIFRP